MKKLLYLCVSALVLTLGTADVFANPLGKIGREINRSTNKVVNEVKRTPGNVAEGIASIPTPRINVRETEPSRLAVLCNLCGKPTYSCSCWRNSSSTTAPKPVRCGTCGQTYTYGTPHHCPKLPTPVTKTCPQCKTVYPAARTHVCPAPKGWQPQPLNQPYKYQPQLSERQNWESMLTHSLASGINNAIQRRLENPTAAQEARAAAAERREQLLWERQQRQQIRRR